MITDEELEKRAAKLAEDRFPGADDSGAISDVALYNGYRIATMDRLRDARESLRLLDPNPDERSSQVAHLEDCQFYEDVVAGEVGTGPWDTAMEPGPCTCGLDAHIAHLKQLLGV